MTTVRIQRALKTHESNLRKYEKARLSQINFDQFMYVGRIMVKSFCELVHARDAANFPLVRIKQ